MAAAWCHATLLKRSMVPALRHVTLLKRTMVPAWCRATLLKRAMATGECHCYPSQAIDGPGVARCHPSQKTETSGHLPEGFGTFFPALGAGAGYLDHLPRAPNQVHTGMGGKSSQPKHNAIPHRLVGKGSAVMCATSSLKGEGTRLTRQTSRIFWEGWPGQKPLPIHLFFPRFWDNLSPDSVSAKSQKQRDYSLSASHSSFTPLQFKPLVAFKSGLRLSWRALATSRVCRAG